MAHALSITDGTDTFSLSTTTAYMLNYAMAAPQLQQPSVTETVDVMIHGASTSAMQTNVSSLERLLESARRRRMEGYGPRVYLNVQLDSDGSAWRSEIFDARLDLVENSLAVWGNAKMQASLYIERAPYWEGALTQLSLTNGNGTDNTSGLTIYNHNDSGMGHDNWVAIDAAEVTGNLPAPVKLELTNSIGSARAIYQVFAATNAFNTPGSLEHLLEGESTVTGGGSTTGSDAACSNGSYASQSVSNDGTMDFTLSSTVMGYCAGYPFHVLVRFFAAPSTLVKASIVSGTSNILMTGEQVNFLSGSSQDLVNFGVLYIPPGGYQTSYGAHKLRLTFRHSGAQTVQVDYFALFPAYAFRDLLTHGSSLANGDKITDDPIEGQAYTTSSSVNLPEVIQRGSPVMLWPNKAQRIYILWSLFDHTSTISDTMTVKAWYRPRRATV